MSCAKRLATWILLGLLGAILLFAAACETTPHDRVVQGQRALATGELDLAEEHFLQALEEDPNIFEAHRLMAVIHRQRGDFEEAHDLLIELWTSQGLDGESLNWSQRSRQDMLKTQFDDLYADWLTSLDAGADAEEYENVLVAGLERDGRNPVLIRHAIDFYQERARRLVERGERIRAAEVLEKIDALPTFPDDRRFARDEARRLRLEAFAQEALARFEGGVLPGLSQAVTYDPDEEMLTIAVDMPVDRGLDPEGEEDQIQARELARARLVTMLAPMLMATAGLESDEVDLDRIGVDDGHIHDENFRRGRLEVTGRFSLDDLIEKAFEYAEFERTRDDEVVSMEVGDDEEDEGGQGD